MPDVSLGTDNLVVGELAAAHHNRKTQKDFVLLNLSSSSSRTHIHGEGRDLGRLTRQIRHGIDRLAILKHFKMQMRAGRTTG